MTKTRLSPLIDAAADRWHAEHLHCPSCDELQEFDWAEIEGVRVISDIWAEQSTCGECGYQMVWRVREKADRTGVESQLVYPRQPRLH